MGRDRTPEPGAKGKKHHRASESGKTRASVKRQQSVNRRENNLKQNWIARVERWEPSQRFELRVQIRAERKHNSKLTPEKRRELHAVLEAIEYADKHARPKGNTYLYGVRTIRSGGLPSQGKRH